MGDREGGVVMVNGVGDGMKKQGWGLWVKRWGDRGGVVMVNGRRRWDEEVGLGGWGGVKRWG